jgi:hypothetical protein
LKSLGYENYGQYLVGAHWSSVKKACYASEVCWGVCNRWIASKLAHCSASTRTANNVTTRHSKPKGYSITSPARTSMQDIELARISQRVWLALSNRWVAWPYFVA